VAEHVHRARVLQAQDHDPAHGDAVVHGVGEGAAGHAAGLADLEDDAVGQRGLVGVERELCGLRGGEERDGLGAVEAARVELRGLGVPDGA
jgi:hypothetical protein